MNGNNCSECHRAIRDQWIYKVGGSLHHASCLNCVVCNGQLDETCYCYNGAYYCKKDYFTYFGPRCGSCQITIQFDEYSTRLGDFFFHPNCLNCSVCHVQILKGQNVGFSNDGLLYCEDHSFMSYMKTTLPYGSFDSGIESDLSVNESGSNTPSSLMNLDDNNSSKSPESEDDDEKVKDLDENGKENKRRGPRTTIKAKQFEVLKTVFSQTPKPTRLMREQLAKETGLPMRVIQVWFQNKRSKEKRMHQMRFMARGPFLPPNASRRGGPGMRYPGYYPGPHELPPGGGYLGGAPGGAGGGNGGPPEPPYGGPPGDFGNFYPPNASSNGYNNGDPGNPEGMFDSSFPSPPPNHGDYPGGGPGEGPDGGPFNECYPSPTDFPSSNPNNNNSPVAASAPNGPSSSRETSNLATVSSSSSAPSGGGGGGVCPPPPPQTANGQQPTLVS